MRSWFKFGKRVPAEPPKEYTLLVRAYLVDVDEPLHMGSFHGVDLDDVTYRARVYVNHCLAAGGVQAELDGKIIAIPMHRAHRIEISEAIKLEV